MDLQVSSGFLPISGGERDRKEIPSMGILIDLDSIGEDIHDTSNCWEFHDNIQRFY